jgi:hypothetical protein
MDFSIEQLILDGALEVSGLDPETGEMLYNFTAEAKDVVPELLKSHQNRIHADIMYFWEHGFVSIENLDEANPSIALTEKAFNKESIQELNPDHKRSLFMIKRSFGII